MNFDFSDEQKQMRDEARKFLSEKCSPKAVRVVLDGKALYDKELWKGLAEMGFLGVAIPEEFGGAGAGAQKKKWLPKIAAGEAIGTLALFEGTGNPSPKAIKLTANGGALNGVK